MVNLTMFQYAFLKGCAPDVTPHLCLYCFHHAGGNANHFAKWPASLPGIEVWAIQLPHRFLPNEAMGATSLIELLPDIADEIIDVQQTSLLPFAFYGHSLGALVAFELARTLRVRGGPQPFALTISGHRAPHRKPGQPPLHTLDQAALVGYLRSWGGMPESVLADARALSYFLPTLRADLRLSETYRYHIEPPLSLPLFGFRGTHDPLLTTSDFTAWTIETSGPSVLRTLSGNHFFDTQGLEAMQAHLVADLTALAGHVRGGVHKSTEVR